MSFADVERVLGAMLPKSAGAGVVGQRSRPAARHVQSWAWLSVGYRASLLSGERVRFAKER